MKKSTPPTYQETDRDREILLIWLQDDDLKGNMNHTGAVRVFKSPVIRKQDLNCKQPFEILEKIEKNCLDSILLKFET